MKNIYITLIALLCSCQPALANSKTDHMIIGGVIGAVVNNEYNKTKQHQNTQVVITPNSTYNESYRTYKGNATLIKIETICHYSSLTNDIKVISKTGNCPTTLVMR